MYRFQGSNGVSAVNGASGANAGGRWATLKSEDDRPAVNTSLPARTAPKLAPTTLAQATQATQATLDKNATQATLKPMNKKQTPMTESLDEFPSLSKTSSTLKAAVAPTSSTASSYANLSKDWAKKQQEDKEKEEKEKEAAARWNALQREQREKEERSFKRTGIISFPHIQKKVDSDEEKYMEDEREISEDDDLSLEEEEEEEDFDEDWGNRKHKYDIY
jgi:hypothetical protein